MIPVYEPWLTDLEREYARKAVESGWISSTGPYIDRFEDEFAKYIGTKYAVATNNGTSACHLALLAAGIGPGDEVIIPNITFIATANAVRYLGATPVIVDICGDSWNMDLDNLPITSKTKAIFCVHLMGNPCDYERLEEIRRRYNILVIEDACEALGASYKDKKVGSWFDAASFSFYGNKTITTGEGGMVTTNNLDIYRKLKLYKGQGQTDRYFHPVVGYNYRMTNVAAAIGCAQLERIDTILAEKARVYCRYKKNLANMRYQYVPNGYTHGYWMVACSGIRRLASINDLSFDTRPMFKPLTSMPPYADLYESAKYPISYNISDACIMLPSYPTLSNEQIDSICRETLERLDLDWGKLQKEMKDELVYQVLNKRHKFNGYS